MRALLVLAALLPALPAYANDCEIAGHAAERANGLPDGLLLAIGRVESGRRAADGHFAAWPWSVNAAGEGHFLASAGEAVALVAALQLRGVRSIDVGCFQVNLQYHPEAFASLADAFEPAANAAAAAQFLQTLHKTGNGWDDAVGRYHSADPELGLPYARQVAASWRGGAMMAAPLSEVAALVRVIVPQASGWRGVAPGVRSFGAGLPVVIVPVSLRL